MEENPLEKRNNDIRARALSDALGYVRLMNRKLPGSLALRYAGIATLDAIEGDPMLSPILSKSKSDLNLDPAEMERYLSHLDKAIKNLIKN
jgi:hypothetical protein